MKVEIVEIDRDYRTQSGTEIKEFSTLEDAELYCKDESWTGYFYYIKRVIEETHKGCDV